MIVNTNIHTYYFLIVCKAWQVPRVHARVVIAVLSESVSMGEIEDVRAHLPEDNRQLFMVENEEDLPGITEENL